MTWLFAELTEIRPPLSFDETALPSTLPCVVTEMFAPAVRLALPLIVVDTVAEALENDFASETLISPPPPPVADAETIWSPVDAANGTASPMPSEPLRPRRRARC